MDKKTLNDFIEFIKRENESAYMSMFHGITHWQNVERFGLMLAEKYPAADTEVIRWFAYIHDSMRGNGKENETHGAAAAKLVTRIRRTFLSNLRDSQIDTLKTACRFHTSRRKTGNLTADICLDADRLDLWRVMTTPEPKRMATEAGALYAKMPYEELKSAAAEIKID